VGEALPSAPEIAAVLPEGIRGGVIPVQRLPAIWRAFGPFLAYHTFAFTGNAWLDTALLSLMQALVLVMIVTGWRLSRRKSRRPPVAPKHPSGDRRTGASALPS
jgi:hypothetical protein